MSTAGGNRANLDTPGKAQDAILVVRVGALGDTLMATPVADALKTQEATRRIDFLCSAAAAPLLRLNPSIGRVYPLKQRNIPFFLSPEKISLSRSLKAEKYAWAVLLESAPRYRYLLERAGVKSIRSFRETPFDPALHSAANNLRAAGLDWEKWPLEAELKPAGQDLQTAARLLEGLKPPLVGLHAGYGPAGKKTDQALRLKGWPLGNFAVLGRLLISAGASLVLTGSVQDRPEAEQISASLPGDQVRVLAGKTNVGELAGAISQLQLFISVDSGPAHMAAAAGVPLIVLWGPAKLQQVRPLSRRSPVVVIQHPVPCAPCYDTPAMKSCRRNVCMQLIAPHRVMAEASRFLMMTSSKF